MKSGPSFEKKTISFSYVTHQLTETAIYLTTVKVIELVSVLYVSYYIIIYTLERSIGLLVLTMVLIACHFRIKYHVVIFLTILRNRKKSSKRRVNNFVMLLINRVNRFLKERKRSIINRSFLQANSLGSRPPVYWYIFE